MGLSSSKKEVIKQENVETNSKQNYSTTTENTTVLPSIKQMKG